MNLNDAIEKFKVISIIRAVGSDRIIPVADALYKGGIRLIEVTFDQKDPECIAKTSSSIKKLKEYFSDNVFIGAGTVMNTDQVNAAYEAGAGYIISPDTNSEVISLTVKLAMTSIPGAFTPGEIVQAHNYGASYVKIFPAGVLGPGYIKAVTAPLSHIKLLAVGGVDENNMEDFFKAGVKGFGIGSNIVDKKAAEEGRYDDITIKASEFSYRALNLR